MNTTMKFMIFDQLRELVLAKGDVYYNVAFCDAQKKEKYVRSSIVAFFGSLLSNVFVYPLERARIIMSLNMRPLKSGEKRKTLIGVLYKQARKEGILSLYRTYWLNTLVAAPYTAITLGFYDVYRYNLFKQGYIDLYSRYTLIGLVSTLSSQTLTYPIDTVRRLLQADSMLIVPEKQYSGVRDCFKKVYQNEGIRGFFKGYGLAALKTPVQTILTLLTYEYTRRLIALVARDDV